MKFEFMRGNLERSRRTITLQAALLLGLIAVNLVTALTAYRLIGAQRVVVVPPAVHKSFWVENDRVSAEYLEQMGYFLVQLALNVTPQSVDYQSKLLLQYVAPASYGEIKTAMTIAAERVKRDGASTVFSARNLTTDEHAMKVAIQGSLTTFIGDRRVSEVMKSYLVELQYAAGKLTIKSFREVTVNDPLDNKSGTPGVSAVG
jgi:conjugal transfer pilus assembly protein TraE